MAVYVALPGELLSLLIACGAHGLPRRTLTVSTGRLTPRRRWYPLVPLVPCPRAVCKAAGSCASKRVADVTD